MIATAPRRKQAPVAHGWRRSATTPHIRPDAGTLPYQAPVGTAVEATFEEVAPGQLIHEWRAVA